jgi:O-antigen ligase
MINDFLSSNLRIRLLKLLIMSIPFDTISIIIPQLRLPVLIFFLYLFISIITWDKQFNFSSTIKPLLLIILLYSLIFLVSYQNVTNSTGAGKSFLNQFIIFIFLFYFISTELINLNIGFDQVMKWYITGVSILLLLFILGIEVTERGGGRLSVAGANPNAIAIYSNIALIFIVNLFEKLQLTIKAKYFYLFLVPGLFYIAILSGSRGGFIGLALAFFVYYFFSNIGSGQRMMSIVKAVIGVVILSAIFLSNDLLYSRFFEQEGSLADSRMPLWEVGYSIVKNDLLFGVGLFRYQQEITLIMGRYIAIHNEYLGILIYSGLVGLALFILFIYTCFKSAMFVSRQYNNPMFLSLLVMIVFVLFKGGGTFLSLFTWFILALAYSSKFSYQNYYAQNSLQ